MSSLSDDESEPFEFPLRSDSVTHQSLSRDGQEDARTRRNLSGAGQRRVGENPLWIQGDTAPYGGVALPLPLPRPVPPNQANSGRYVAAPFQLPDMTAEARRERIMAIDRKRRLTGSSHDVNSRRRTIPGGSSDRGNVAQHSISETHQSRSRSPGSYQRQRGVPAPTAEVIDLTSSPPQRPIVSPSLTRRSSGSTSGVYVVPRWQPDEDVTECPICQRPFTLMFRRHHCRKCGRVVCDKCSPHRITIPRQFIVNPPGSTLNPSFSGRNTVDFTGDDDEDENAPQMVHPGLSRQYQYNAGIGGGEKVRLCNPCVPDPQPEPQPNYGPDTSPSPNPQGRRAELMTLSDVLRSTRHDPQPANNPESFAGFQQHPPPYESQISGLRPLPLPPQSSRTHTDFDASYLNQFPFSSTGPSSLNSRQRQQSNPGPRYRHRGHMSFDSPSTLHHRQFASESSRSPSQPVNRPRIRSMLEETYLPRSFAAPIGPPRPRLNEEDICPICRRALPPKGQDGDETAREAHIIECISSRDPSNQMGSARGLGVQSPPRGPMHMLPFIATEKDCVSEDGNVPECSICMVEYDVGDELARLECLCKFHRECISEWFTRKQECPVHKIA